MVACRSPRPPNTWVLDTVHGCRCLPLLSRKYGTVKIISCCSANMLIEVKETYWLIPAAYVTPLLKGTFQGRVGLHPDKEGHLGSLGNEIVASIPTPVAFQARYPGVSADLEDPQSPRPDVFRNIWIDAREIERAA